MIASLVPGWLDGTAQGLFLTVTAGRPARTSDQGACPAVKGYWRVHRFGFWRVAGSPPSLPKRLLI